MSAYKNFVISDRTLAVQGSSRGILSPVHINTVASYLQKVEERQAPEDFDRELVHLKVSFTKQKMTAYWDDESKPYRMLVTSVGASQLASAVLPGHFFKGLRQLATMDDSGSKIATDAWEKFNHQNGTTPMRVRTVRMKLDNEVYRVIRACVSVNYACYSNLEFVQSIVDHSGRFGQLPVLNWRLSDSGMRIRFVGMEDSTFALANLDETLLDDEPLPMIEAWNSEVARRKLGFRGGLYHPQLGFALPHWHSSTEYGWIHRGSVARIQAGVEIAFTDLFTTAAEVIDAYTKAKEIGVENPTVWLKEQLENVVTARVQEAALKNLKEDKGITPGGKLASIVEAIALTAQQEEDLYDQESIENVAAKVMAKGLSQANNNILKTRKV